MRGRRSGEPSRAICRMRMRPRSASTTTRPRCWEGPGAGTSSSGREVFSRNQTNKYFQEVEIRLRTTITPHSCTGYEVFWRCLKTEEAYAEIVRWDGVIKTWKSLTRKVGPEFGVKDGDIVEACIIGNEIRGYINGVLVTAGDRRYVHGRWSGRGLQLRRRGHQCRPRVDALPGRHIRRLTAGAPVAPALDWRLPSACCWRIANAGRRGR